MISSIRLDLLDLFGDKYIFEHCINEYKKFQQKKAMFQYVADGLYCLTNGKTLISQFEFIDFKPKKQKSPEEIKESIKAKLRG